MYVSELLYDYCATSNASDHALHVVGHCSWLEGRSTRTRTFFQILDLQEKQEILPKIGKKLKEGKMSGTVSHIFYIREKCETDSGPVQTTLKLSEKLSETKNEKQNLKSN